MKARREKAEFRKYFGYHCYEAYMEIEWEDRRKGNVCAIRETLENGNALHAMTLRSRKHLVRGRRENARVRAIYKKYVLPYYHDIHNWDVIE